MERDSRSRLRGDEQVAAQPQTRVVHADLSDDSGFSESQYSRFDWSFDFQQNAIALDPRHPVPVLRHQSVTGECGLGRNGYGSAFCGQKLSTLLEHNFSAGV